jgi:nucleoside-diphosphate-sugar epimerase
MNKKILVTGGAGYIGSMLVTELVKLGYNVTVIDRFDFEKNSLNHLFFYKNFTFIEKDLLKIKKKEINYKKFNFIIPLAALVGAPLCKKKPLEAKKINYKWVKNLLKNISEKQKIIYPTTNSGYGVGEKDRFCDENSKLNPISLYAVTKMKAENEILKHQNSISLRLATVFGSSYRMRTDLIVNNFVLKGIKNKKLELFEPHFRRNFIHIKDVVNAIIFSIKNFNKIKNNIFNLGLSNANITKMELAKKIKSFLPNLKIKTIVNKKDPDQRDYFVSNKKIESKGFKAKIDLDTGIQELIKLYNVNNVFKNNY